MYGCHRAFADGSLLIQGMGPFYHECLGEGRLLQENTNAGPLDYVLFNSADGF